MGMSLEDHGSRAYDHSALAPLISFGAHVIKATVRGRQRFGLGQGTLASDLPGTIHIGHQPGLGASIGDPTRISKRLAGQQVLLEQGAHVLNAGLIERGEKTGQSGARGQTLAAKQGHEFIGKWPKALVKGLQGWLSRERVADEDHDKIDEIVGAHTGTSKADSLGDGIEDAKLLENLSYRSHFSHPMWSGRQRLRRGLDGKG